MKLLLTSLLAVSASCGTSLGAPATASSEVPALARVEEGGSQLMPGDDEDDGGDDDDDDEDVAVMGVVAG